jgi:hypothetical protein
MWLERNNVYFQVVAAILLSGMSLLVGYLQYVVSQEQLNLAEIEHTPLLVVREETVVDSSHNVMRVIDIENARGHVFGFHSQLRGLVSVSYDPAEQTGNVQINRVYDWVHSTGATQGSLVRYVIREDDVRDQWYEDTVAVERSANYLYRCSQQRILTISYSDFKGKKNVVRYEIHPSFGVNRLNKSESTIIAARLSGAPVCRVRNLNLGRVVAMIFGNKVNRNN